MLKRVHSEVSQSRSFGMSVDSEDATLFAELGDLDFSQLSFPNPCVLGKSVSIIPKTSVVRYDARVRIYFAALLFVVGASTFASHAATQKRRSAPQLYRRHCISCHGSDGRAKTSKGKFSHARDLANPEWQADVSDERIFNSIMNGRNVRGNMPSFSNKLNEKEINSLVGFVRKLNVPE